MNLALVFGFAFAGTSTALPSVTGTFSSLVYHEDSGDLLGAEFRIVYSHSGHFITAQCSAGVPVTKPIEINGNEFSFVLEEASEDDVSLCGVGKFSGRVDEKGLLFWKESEETAVFLPRQESYWEKRSRVMSESVEQ